MKKLQDLHKYLDDMQNDLSNIRMSLQDKFELVGNFVENELSDAITVVDSALDRIQELEDELEEAKNRIEELEREVNEAV
jgi:predicted RNase H-like nuclease (RuvC/YqgF family)